MAEPLMRHYMRGDFLDEAVKFRVDAAEQKPALRRIDIGGNRQIYEIRPRLPEIKIRLLGDVDVVVRGAAEKFGADLHLGTSLIERVLGHGVRRHVSQERA